MTSEAMPIVQAPGTAYPSLLSPFRLKRLTLRNRVMSSAHAPVYTDQGVPAERYQLYHEEKAKGGIALTMFGGSSTVAREFQCHLQPDLCRLGPRGAVFPRAGGAGASARRGADVPDHAYGPAHVVGRRRLVRHPGTLGRPRSGASFGAAGDEHARHRPHRQGVRRRRGALPRRRPGRLRDPHHHPSARPVPLAAVQPPRGRVWRQPGEPGAVHAGGDRRGAQPGRRRFHRRRALHRQREQRGRADRRGGHRNRPAAGPDRRGGFPQRQRPLCRHHGRQFADLSRHGVARRPLHHAGAAGARGVRPAGVPGGAHPRSRDRRARRCRRLPRHGGDDAPAHRRPAHAGQARARRGAADPPLRRRQLLHGPRLSRP